MTCYHPQKAYKSREFNRDTGKYAITFNPMKALNVDHPISLPCGKCIGCRIAKSREWALRCVHESQMHAHNSFITLTYDDQHVPVSYSLDLRHWQLFMKRLRFEVGTKLRFFACGEYGDQGQRPHYHALIFGYDFHSDRKIYTHRNKNPVWRSDQLQRLWQFGNHEIGAVNFQSAAYCARYVMKKRGGEKAADHYNRVSPIDGERYNVRPEFAVMSRRPGLGTTWFEKFKADAFPSDFLIVDGRKVRPPAFYLDKLEEDEQTPIKRHRKRESLPHRWNNTPARLEVRETIQQVRAQRLLRKLES